MGDGLAGLLFGWLMVLVQALTAVTATPAPVVAVHHRFPVVGQVSYGAAHHDYPATDIFAACGSRVVAPVDGVVLEAHRQDRWDPATNLGATRGGRSFAVRGVDGVRYYGSHLAWLRPVIRPGARVTAGEPVGRVGASGDARYVGCHLHFGISPVCPSRPGAWWIRRGAVSPYLFLRSWQRGHNASPVRSVHRWWLRHGCPAAPLTDP